MTKMTMWDVFRYNVNKFNYIFQFKMFHMEMVHFNTARNFSINYTQFMGTKMANMYRYSLLSFLVRVLLYIATCGN
jgi:hypothetical protein